MIRSVLLVFLVCIGFISEAQEDWLLRAQKMYDLGQIEKIHDYIQPFLPSATREEQISSYRLLVLCNIYEKKPNEADSLMRTLLNFENEYALQSSDSVGEFADLFNTYRTNPVYGVSASFGYITPMVMPLKNFGTGNLLENNYKYSPTSLSFHIGGSFLVFLKRNMCFDFGLHYTMLNYTNQVNLNQMMNVSFAETQHLLTIPILFKYSSSYKKIRPFFSVGVSLNKMMSSSADIVRHFNGAVSPDVTGPPVDITNARASYVYGAQVGLGVDYKIKHALIGVELRYQYALNSVVTSNSRYANPDLIYRYYYVDNDFKIDYFSITFRYTYLLYSPKKQIIK